MKRSGLVGLALLLTLSSATSLRAASCSDPLTIKTVPDIQAHMAFPIDYQAKVSKVCGSMLWEVLEGPPGFQIDGAGGRFYWTPSAFWSGRITIQVTESGSRGTTRATQSFQVAVDDNTITSPLFRDYLSASGTVPIMGRAHGEGFLSYSLDYSELGARVRHPIAGPVTTSVATTGKLADWDISGLPEGGRFQLNLRVKFDDGSTSVVSDPVIIDRTAKSGWPKRIGPLTHSIAVADLDDDGRKEILAVTHFGELYVWRIDGTLLWKTARLGASYSGPSVGDIDGDGRPEIIWSSIYGLYAYRTDGSLVPGFPFHPREETEFRTTATLVDLDGDGRLDIIAGAQGRSAQTRAEVWALRYRSTEPEPVPGWPREIDHFSLYASPAVGDLDGDRIPEVVAESYDKVYAWHADGTPVQGLDRAHLVSPITGTKAVSAGSPHSSSQPVIVDLDGDGRPEIVVASNVLRADGTPMTGWTSPKLGAINSLSAAVGDLDRNPGNGLEVVLGNLAWHADGSRFPRRALAREAGVALLADCGDGHDLDTMLSSRSQTGRGAILAFDPEAAALESYPKNLFGEAGDASAPVLGDFDGDGFLDLAIGITDESYGGVVAVYNLPGPNHDENHAWTMLGHDVRRTGLYTIPPPNRPLGLRAAAGSIAWEDSSGVENAYVVERSASGAAGTFLPVATLPASSTTSGASGGGFYRVRALRQDPQSGQTIPSDPSLTVHVP